MIYRVQQFNDQNFFRIMKVGVLCENLPSPANIVSVSSSFEKCWVLKNTGTRNWCTGIVVSFCLKFYCARIYTTCIYLD